MNCCTYEQKCTVMFIEEIAVMKKYEYKFVKEGIRTGALAFQDCSH